MSERDFELLDAETVHDGPLISVRVERYRYPDGEVAERTVVKHPGAVAIVAHDEQHLILVRQPREAVGDPDSLELPAGKLEAGESPLVTGRRELAEEVGLAASDWVLLRSYRSSPGVMDEIVHVYLATGLSDASAEAEENERIEIVRWPLEQLDGAIDATSDAKTLIGLLLLRERRRSAGG